MSSHSKESKNEGLGCCIVLLIIVAIIFVPLIFSSLSDLNKSKQEGKLIQEGKTISANEVANEFIDILKNRDEEKLKRHLTNDFKYIDDNRNESKSISNFWNDLKYLVEEKYDLEKRDNSIKDEETYFIYWNTNGIIKERTDRLYCLQKISIYLKKIVETGKITFKIYKIMLTDN